MPAETVPQPSAIPDQSSMGDSSDFVRLHITPLDSELLKVVIPSSVLPVARNISYHTLETFPEKRYGFVELPQTDAEKLKRRLHGSVLKGCKMRIEKARPEERVERAESTGEVEKAPKKKKSSKEGSEGSKKRKREVDVMDGMVLKDRKVKRGWTEAPPTTYTKKSKKDKESKDKEKRKRPKSKYTDQEECLLKTKLPPTAMGNIPAEDLVKNKKKKGSSRLVTIHEFEKTTKFPSFLKMSATETNDKPAAEFVEGKGWVDDEGNVVEAVKEPRVPERRKKTVKPKPAVEEEDDDSTSSSGTSSDGTSSEEEESDDEEATQTSKTKSQAKSQAKSQDKSKNESSSESSSESDSSEVESSSKLPEHETPLSATKKNGPKQSPGSSKPLAIKIPPPETPSVAMVHPLEALYKKAKPDAEAAQAPAAPNAEPFSFFADDDGEEEEEEDEEEGESGAPTVAVPMTPFTRQDYEWRNVRSAAPTPDTAHPTRMQRFFTGSPEKDIDMDCDVVEEEDEEEEEGEEDAPAQGQQPTSDFQKWFWENRRELNRTWMSRRKTAAKEKRHRENKARASKAV